MDWIWIWIVLFTILVHMVKLTPNLTIVTYCYCQVFRAIRGPGIDPWVG